MSAEAERAYREALALWPGNPEAIAALTFYLWDRGAFDEAIELYDAALEDDPDSIDLWRLRTYAEKRKETAGEIRALAKGWPINQNRGEALRMVDYVFQRGRNKQGRPSAPAGASRFSRGRGYARFVLRYYEERGELAKTLETGPTSHPCGDFKRPQLSSACTGVLRAEQKEEFYEAARDAIRLGGPSLRKAFLVIRHSLCGRTIPSSRNWLRSNRLPPD